MASYDEAPSVRLEGDEKRALALIPEGKLLLSKVQAFVQRAEIPTYSMSRRVSDDEYIYVLVAGGRGIIHISAGVVFPDAVHREEPERREGTRFPDFLSGLVFNGTMDDHQETRADGSTISYKAIRQWAPTPNCAQVQGINVGRQISRRLAVRPHESMSEWQSPLLFRENSQYVTPRTSQWSGTMKKVVQVVFGLGHIGKDKLRDPKDPTTTTRYMRDVEHSGVQVQYDYKFMRTHGIYRGPDNTLWLIEISAGKGVIAMPLPIFPDSDTQAFALRAEQRGDRAMQLVLEELGCLPTGESFPTGAAYQEKLDSGDILQLLSSDAMQEFYRLSGYSSICGWAFNEAGNEAHNVGYHWPDGVGVQKGYWYLININIGSVNQHRLPGQPIANGSASLKLQNSGYLYSSEEGGFIPVKYFEPLLPVPGLLSHSAKPIGPVSSAVNCDTPVFVAFMNGDLKVARYFRSWRVEMYDQSTDDRSPDECLLEGTWTWTRMTGSNSLPAMPYTNDIDPRSVLEEHFQTSTLTSNSLGFDPPRFSDFIDAPEGCIVWRDKVWKNTTVFEERGGESRGACFIVPGYSREAYYYFEGHFYNGGRRGAISTIYPRVTDPHIYYGWRDFPRISYPPYPPGRGCETWKCGGRHAERRVVCWEYSKHACYDYADSGPWASECQDIVSLCAGTTPIRVPSHVQWNKGVDFKGTWNFFSNGLNGPAFGPITQGEYEYAMAPSPDPDTMDTQLIYAEHSAIGEDCAIFTKGFFGERVVMGYTPVPLIDSDGMPLFIGVNQP